MKKKPFLVNWCIIALALVMTLFSMFKKKPLLFIWFISVIILCFIALKTRGFTYYHGYFQSWVPGFMWLISILILLIPGLSFLSKKIVQKQDQHSRDIQRRAFYWGEK
jgi:hypothetical protein